MDNTLKSLFLLSLFYQQILFISKFFKRILQIIHKIVENLLQIHLKFVKNSFYETFQKMLHLLIVFNIIHTQGGVYGSIDDFWKILLAHLKKQFRFTKLNIGFMPVKLLKVIQIIFILSSFSNICNFWEDNLLTDVMEH